MKTLFKLISGVTLFIGSKLALAHPGHEAGGMLADVGHAFSAIDYFLGAVLTCALIYHLIKRTD